MIDMMPSRLRNLKLAVESYDKSGIPFTFRSGDSFTAAGSSDDVGLYYFIPEIAKLLNISAVSAINVFFILIIGISAALGLTGLFLLFKSLLSRVVSVIGILLLSIATWSIGDLYVAHTVAILSIIPLFLYLVSKKKISRNLFIFFALSGLTLGSLHLIRSHSGTAVIIFITIILLFRIRSNWLQKTAILIVLLSTFMVPKLYVDRLLDKRDAFLVKEDNTYTKVNRKHPLWHSIYIGFGFLSNDYGIEYKDTVAYDKVASIDDEVISLSPRSEKILRAEVISLFKTAPKFVIHTIFSKLGVVLLYLLAFANIGLIAAIKYPKERLLDIAFGSGLAFSALFPVFVMPTPNYALGVIALATLYGIISINYALDSRRTTTI